MRRQKSAGILSGRQSESKQKESLMMIDWNEYHKEIGSRMGELMKLSPDTVRGYRARHVAFCVISGPIIIRFTPWSSCVAIPIF